MLNVCGYVPWLEQQDLFYRELDAFLAAALSPVRGIFIVHR